MHLAVSEVRAQLAATVGQGSGLSDVYSQGCAAQHVGGCVCDSAVNRLWPGHQHDLVGHEARSCPVTAPAVPADQEEEHHS